MTYQEIKDRLTKCENTLNLIKNGQYKNKEKVDIKETTKKLEVLRESLQKQLAEADKGTISTDDEEKAKDLADDGANVNLTSEMKPGDPEDLERKRMDRLTPEDREKLKQIRAMMKNANNMEEAEHQAEEDDLDVGHTDDEPSMLKKDLYDIITNAAKLYKQLHKYDQGDGEVDFPHWWQSKVIKAKDYIGAAQHYLEAEEKQPAIDRLALEENIKESPMTMAYTKIVKPKPKANEARDLSDIQADIDKVKKLAPSMNKLPQDDPKRKGFIAKVKKLNQEKKDYEAGVHSKIKKTGADQELDTTDEAQATGFGTGQGRSKTISRGREERPDLAQARKDAIKPKKKYVMKNGIPHKYDADGNLVPLKKMNEYRGAQEDIIEVIKQMALQGDGDEIEAAMEVMEFIGQEFKIDFEFGRAGGGNYGRNQGNPYEDKALEEEDKVGETKEAPAGHYFTKSGNLVKGKMTKDAKERGARKSDPKDKTRSKVPPVSQYK